MGSKKNTSCDGAWGGTFAGKKCEGTVKISQKLVKIKPKSRIQRVVQLGVADIGDNVPKPLHELMRRREVAIAGKRPEHDGCDLLADGIVAEQVQPRGLEVRQRAERLAGPAFPGEPPEHAHVRV